MNAKKERNENICNKVNGRKERKKERKKERENSETRQKA